MEERKSRGEVEEHKSMIQTEERKSRGHMDE
jgi:hypothetical protein